MHETRLVAGEEAEKREDHGHEGAYQGYEAGCALHGDHVECLSLKMDKQDKPRRFLMQQAEVKEKEALLSGVER